MTDPARPQLQEAEAASVHEIVSRLGALRRRIRAIFTIVGASRVLVSLVALLALFFLADRFLDLPVGVRQFIRLGLFDRPDAMPFLVWIPLLGIALFLAIALTRSGKGAAGLFAFIAGGIIGVVVWIGVRAFMPLRVRLSDEELALTVEERFGQLNDRLAAALDFEQELKSPSRGESPVMMERVVDEAVAQVRGLSLGRAASPRRAVQWMGFAALALGVVALSLMTMPDTVSLWFARSIQLQDKAWPRATTMLAVTVDADGTVTDVDPAKAYEVALGRPLVVHALAKGKVPDEVFLVDLVDGQQPLARRMFSVPELPGVFAFEFRDVRRPFEFLLRGGDDEDDQPRYRVEITIPPRVLEIASTVSYPDYLGGALQRIGSGNVTAPEGSRIEVTFRTDVHVAEATLLMGDESRLVERGTDENSFQFAFDATAPATYRLLLRTPEGRTNDASMDTYEVRVRRDHAPRIEWVYPRGTFEVTPEGRIPLIARTTDDYAVTKLTLQVRTGSEQVTDLEILPADASFGEGQLAGNDGEYGRTQVLTYLPLDVPDLETPDGDKIEAPRQLSFRLVALDSLGQTREGDWTYVDVFGSPELERGLAGQRSGVRSSIAAIRAEQQTRRDELSGVLDGPVESGEMDVIKTVRFSQGKIAQDADQAARRLNEIFNAFVYDRMGARSPTEKILGYFGSHHRKTYGLAPVEQSADEASGQTEGAWVGDPVFPYALYNEIVAAWHNKVIYDRGLIDRMLAVVEDATRVGSELAPAAQTAAAQALSGNKDDIRAAVEAQDRLLSAMDELLEAMKSWQDLSDVKLAVRRLIEEQRTLDTQIEGLERSRNGSDDK